MYIKLSTSNIIITFKNTDFLIYKLLKQVLQYININNLTLLVKTLY